MYPHDMKPYVTCRYCGANRSEKRLSRNGSCVECARRRVLESFDGVTLAVDELVGLRSTAPLSPRPSEVQGRVDRRSGSE